MSHYEVLGVEAAVDDAALRQAYVALARRYHPDRDGGDAARMRAINAAWATLGDPVRRARYDRSLVADVAPARSEPAQSADDQDDDLLDDRALHAAVRLPPWLSLVPPALFVLALGSWVLGVVLGAPPLVGLGAVAFLLSCLFFLAAPFIALFAARTGAGSEPRHR